MSLVAITREVSPSINNCELTFHARKPIDVTKAIAQHRAYEDCLRDLGLRIVSLPPEPDLPDAVFVEDPAIVVDEVAIISNMGAPSRRPEAYSLADALAPYRPLKYLVEPATLDGGDVLRVSRTLFVGISQRTNQQAIVQLREILEPHGYEVLPVKVESCLHLKTACSYIGNNTILINQSFIDDAPFRGFELFNVPEDEPNAANVLFVKDVVIIPESFPKTRALLNERNFAVRTVDIGELQKAESGITCSSLIFDAQGN